MRIAIAVAVLVPATVLAEPAAPPARPSTARRGLTFEVAIGPGLAFRDFDGETDFTDVSLAGLDMGLARWVRGDLAIGLRLAGVQLPDEDGDGVASARSVNLVFGPAAQYWFDDHLWAGGGLGFATFRPFSNSDFDAVEGVNGFGFDLRAGYTFARPGSNNSLQLSVEVNPCFYRSDTTRGSLTNLALLVGYQYL